MPRKQSFPNTDTHIWVNTADGGGYWRRRRGTVKPATLNPVLQRNAAHTSLINDAAKRILSRLHSYTEYLSMGRFYSTLVGALRRGYNAAGKTDYTHLHGLDFQPAYPISALLSRHYNVVTSRQQVEVTIPVTAHSVKKHNNLITDYFFELVLLHGDAFTEGDLRIDSDVSATYPITGSPGECVLRVHPPRTPWIVLLRVGCIEKPTAAPVTQVATSARNHAMKIIAVG